MMAKSTYLPMLLLAAGVAMLSGCQSEDVNVKAELDALAAGIPAKIPGLPEPALYEPFAYENAALRDPFVPAWGGSPAVSASSGVRPDLARQKEHLEAFPLDAIRMVGTLARHGKTTALVKVDTSLYSVAVGNYLGTDFGRITKITGAEISLREIVQDVNNVWVERNATVKLEQNEAKK